MRLQPWFPVLATLAAVGTLHAQQATGIHLGVAGEWITIPGRVERGGIAHAAWGGSATLELSFASIPRFALITRLAYAPDRVAPAAPRMLSIGGGLRYALAASRRLNLRPSLELEAVQFTAVEAYNAAMRLCVSDGDVLCPFNPLDYYGEGLLIEDGWRLGISLRPALQVWPMEWVGFEMTPAVRWLLPVSRSLPRGDHDRYRDPVYVTLGVGVVLKV